MSQVLEIINPVEHPRWDDLVASRPEGTFFHTSMWAAVLSESYGYRPVYFALPASGGLPACIPIMEVRSFLTGARGVSLPFTDYCEPITNGEITTEDILGPLIEHGTRAGWRHIEIRGGQEFFGGHTPSSRYIGHRLDLSGGGGRGGGEKDLYSGLKPSTKRNIKKALRAGVEARIHNSLESVKEFCRLNRLTRKRHGLPPQPWRFFENIHKHVISRGHGFVILATLEKRVVAGAVFFHFNKKALYKFGASDERYLDSRANNLVMWEAIRWYSAKGYESFCFGRTETQNRGLRDFKAGWGPQERTINYYKYDLSKKEFVRDPERSAGYRFFNRTPMPVLSAIGNLLYRHIG